MSAKSSTQRIDFNTPALKRKRKLRALKDRLARWYVTFGGLAVLGAVTLIFFYLAWVVLPVFSGAELQLPTELSGPGAIRLVHFWDPACPCNVGNQQHLAELQAMQDAIGLQAQGDQHGGVGVVVTVTLPGQGFPPVRLHGVAGA